MRLNPCRHRAGPRARGRGGLSLVELVAAFSVLSVAFLIYVQTDLLLRRERSAQREVAIAAAAAQRMIETMRSEPFETLYARYDSSPFDDPGGPGTAPGPCFAVSGLQPVSGALRGMAGFIHLPERETSRRVWKLLENDVRPDLGLPRDLDGDSIVDGEDHTDDYVLLPVRVVVDWQSRLGPRHFEITTTLCEVRR